MHHDLLARLLTTLPMQQPADGGTRCSISRLGLAANFHEKTIEPDHSLVTCGQPVPGQHQIRLFHMRPLQVAHLVDEHLQRQLCIEQGVVTPGAQQLPVLVMLDQVVIRIFRKSQRVEPQGIHHWLLQQTQVGLGCLQVRQIEGNQVVPQNKRRRLRQDIELFQRRAQLARGKAQGFSGITTHRTQLMYPRRLTTNLQVDTQALGLE